MPTWQMLDRSQLAVSTSITMKFTGVAPTLAITFVSPNRTEIKRNRVGLDGVR